MQRKNGVWFLIVMGIVALLSGCAAQQHGQPKTFQAQSLADGKWKQKADNLFFILDASSSMLGDYKDMQKFAIGKSVVANFNQTMPDMNVKTAIRTFGHDPSYSKQSTQMAYGPTLYSRAGLSGALDKIKPAGGPSPMDKALAALAGDFKDTQGKIALVIISDGKDMDNAPVNAANGLKAQYGDRLCVYTVLVGDNPAGQKVMGDLSKVTGCGLAVNADQVATPAQMANFVETVLLEAVVSPKAQMPPKSPRGTWVFKDIKFEFDKAVLMTSSYPILENIYAAMRDNPELKVEIQGHTCAMGSDAYNLDLSQRRAQTVMAHLKSKGVSASRLTAKGYGESQPMDTNDTFEGRANNRRVELKPLN